MGGHMPRLKPSDAPEALGSILDSQACTTDMLRAVGAANRVLKRLGFGESHGVVYGGRPRMATLLGPDGNMIAGQLGDYPWAAIGALLLRFLEEEGK